MLTISWLIEGQSNGSTPHPQDGNKISLEVDGATGEVEVDKVSIETGLKVKLETNGTAVEPVAEENFVS